LWPLRGLDARRFAVEDREPVRPGNRFAQVNPPDRRRLIGRLIFIAVLCAAGVAVLGTLFYLSDRFNSFDTRVTVRLLAEPGTGAESLADAAADAANALPLLVLMIGVLALGLFWRRPAWLAAGVVVFIAANLTTQLMKLALSHPRVQGELGASYPVLIGYPSGHTTAALSVAAALWLVAPPGRRRAAGLLGLAYGAAVGIGVVVAGWHFISDVIGAVLVVGFWTALALAALVAAGLEPPRSGTGQIQAERVPRVL
jgi:membrane-associated phospholipid phosphatase